MEFGPDERGQRREFVGKDDRLFTHPQAPPKSVLYGTERDCCAIKWGKVDTRVYRVIILPGLRAQIQPTSMRIRRFYLLDLFGEGY